MSTTSVIPSILTLLLLLTAVTSTSARGAVALVRDLQEELSLARRFAFCAAARAALRAARDCRYAGLPFGIYERLREVCKTRSKSREALAACTATGIACEKEREMLDAAFAACSRIGWDGSGRRAKCPSVAAAKDELAEAEARGCPRAPGRGAAEIEEELDRTAEKATMELGLRTSAYPLRIIEPEKDVADSVVILLHGAAQLNTAMVPFTMGVPSVRFVLPQAATRESVLLNVSLTLWYDLMDFDLVNGPWKTEEILAAARNINDLIEIQRKVYGIDAGRILVAGFSQGGSVAATVYLRYRVAAAILVATFLPIGDTYPAGMTDDSASAPAIMFHGTGDITLPVRIGRAARDMLRKLGRDVKYVEYPGENHELEGVTADVFSRSIKFALGVLG